MRNCLLAAINLRGEVKINPVPKPSSYIAHFRGSFRSQQIIFICLRSVVGFRWFRR